MSVHFEWHGDLVKAQTRAAIVRGLADASGELKEASNAAAPKDSSHLVASSGTDVDEGGLAASVYYDPQTAPRKGKPVYAIVRHEALRQGGSPKYLEKPLIRFRGRFAQIIAGAIGRVL